MYELQKINQNLLSDFIKKVESTIKADKYIHLIKSVEYAIKKELPNEPKYIIEPIVRKIKNQLDLLEKRKVVDFESEEEAQLLFKKRFKEELDLADKNMLSSELANIIYNSYDLCKYDKKLIVNNKEFLFNMNSLILNYRSHEKAYLRWLREKKSKPAEENINISHNTNKSIPDRYKFIKQTYIPFNNNPFYNDAQKKLEQRIINEVEEDRYVMTRAISSMVSINFRMEHVKDETSKTMIKAYKSLHPLINADNPIDKKDIVDSWLTSIASTFLISNPQGIKATTLGKYITTHARYTELYNNFDGEYIIPLEKLRKPRIREVGIYHKLRLLEFTDNRKKLTYSEQSIKDMENYIKNIIYYLDKFKF